MKYQNFKKILIVASVFFLWGCSQEGSGPEEPIEIAMNETEVIDTIEAAAANIEEIINLEDEIIVFKDAVIEEMVRQELDIGTEVPITIAEASTLWRLGNTWYDIVETPDSARQIHTLTDLQYFPNLKSLYLMGMELDSLEGIEALKKLEVIDISRNQITDLTPLSGLENLQELICYQNQIEDLTPLAGLLKLEKISAVANQISDMTVLEKLPGLTAVCLKLNPLEINDQELYDENNKYSIHSNKRMMNGRELLFEGIYYEHSNEEIPQWEDGNEYIIISDCKTGELVNLFRIPECYNNYFLGYKNFDECFIDMNFDGYEDFLLATLSYKAEIRCCFLWNPAKECFEYNDELNGQKLDSSYVRFDDKMKQITVGGKLPGRLQVNYHWENEKLVCVGFEEMIPLIFLDTLTDTEVETIKERIKEQLGKSFQDIYYVGTIGREASPDPMEITYEYIFCPGELIYSPKDGTLGYEIDLHSQAGEWLWDFLDWEAMRMSLFGEYYGTYYYAGRFFY